MAGAERAQKKCATKNCSKKLTTTGGDTKKERPKTLRDEKKFKCEETKIFCEKTKKKF